jgi:hypothetical protein
MATALTTKEEEIATRMDHTPPISFMLWPPTARYNVKKRRAHNFR